jgi:hypothetical protein
LIYNIEIKKNRTHPKFTRSEPPNCSCLLWFCRFLKCSEQPHFQTSTFSQKRLYQTTHNICTTEVPNMAKEAIDKRRTVLFGTISRKGVVDSPIAVELLNQARHRKTQANSTNGRPFLDRVSKHTSRPNHEQKTVSVAGLFKKNSKHATRNGRNKRKEPTPEPEMMDLVCGEFHGRLQVWLLDLI